MYDSGNIGVVDQCTRIHMLEPASSSSLPRFVSFSHHAQLSKHREEVKLQAANKKQFR